MRNLTSALFLFLAAVPMTAAQSFQPSTPGSEQHSELSMLLGFGATIAAVDGEFLIGSASVDWPAGADPAGQIYRFARQADGSWAEIGRLGASDAEHGDEFGRSLLVEGNRLYVGAPAKAAVYVFERTSDGNWNEVDIIHAPDLPEGAEFGGAYARGGYRTQTIARAGHFTAVTSFNGDTGEGAVHVHGNGDEITTIAEVPAWSVFGIGSTLFVGAPSAKERRGEVYVFTHSDGTWIEQSPIVAPDAKEGAGFGHSMASDGERLYVSATGYGTVYVFEPNGTGLWKSTHLITQKTTGEERPAGQFGRNLAVSGGHLAITAQNSVFVVATDDLDADMTRLDAPGEQRGRSFGVGAAISGDVLAVGAPSADYGSGRALFYERQADGSWAEAFDALGDVTSLETMTGSEVECEEGQADGLFPCDNVDLVSFVSTADLANDRGATLNDIWGWEDPETSHEYVLAARTDGVSFVDITDPANPVVVGQMMRTEGSPGAWWRDVKVYNNHAYVVADGSGEHGIQIFDLGRLRDVQPQEMPVDFEADARYTGVASTHNIVINEETGFGYAVGSGSGGESCGGQLHMLDLKDPLNPVFVGCYTHPDFGGTHDAQCVLYRGGDSDYAGREICLNSNGSAFIIADVTDKSAPVTVAVATYPNTAYTHQGWLSEDHRYFYMNDELDEMNNIVDRTRTLVWDVQDLDEPVLVNEFYHGNGASDHNLYIQGNFMYQSNYQAGLRVLDISDPVNPVEFGHFDTAPHADDVRGFGGSWSNYPFFRSGVIAVSSQAEGLFLVRKREVDL